MKILAEIHPDYIDLHKLGQDNIGSTYIATVRGQILDIDHYYDEWSLLMDNLLPYANFIYVDLIQ